MECFIDKRKRKKKNVKSNRIINTHKNNENSSAAKTKNKQKKIKNRTKVNDSLILYILELVLNQTQHTKNHKKTLIRLNTDGTVNTNC